MGWTDDDGDDFFREVRSRDELDQGDAGDQEPEPVTLAIVAWVPVHCPACGSRRLNCTGKPRAMPGIRYHRCLECGVTFKSAEVRPDFFRR